jgi:hypothetical protein
MGISHRYLGHWRATHQLAIPRSTAKQHSTSNERTASVRPMDRPNLPRLTVTALCNTTRKGSSEAVFRTGVIGHSPQATVFRSRDVGLATRTYFPVNRAPRFSKNAVTPSM